MATNVREVFELSKVAKLSKAQARQKIEGGWKALRILRQLRTTDPELRRMLFENLRSKTKDPHFFTPQDRIPVSKE